MGEVVQFYPRARFLVEIDGFKRAGFQKCSGLEQGVEIDEHREGDQILPTKDLGLFSADELTLESGATKDQSAWDWFKLAVDVAAGKLGADFTTYKKDICIVQLDAAGEEVERWNVYGAIPRRFSPGEWDATSGERRIQKLIIAYDYFEPAGGAAAGGAAPTGGGGGAAV